MRSCAQFNIHHPTINGTVNGTVSGMVNGPINGVNKTIIGNAKPVPKNNNQDEDSIGEIGTFFQDPSDQRSTKFIEKLREPEILSDDSKETFNEEDEAESGSQNSFSTSKNDNDSDYISIDTDKSTSEESASDTDASEDNINEKDPPKIGKTAFRKAYNAIPNSTKLQLSTGRIVEDILFEFVKDMDYEHHAHSYIVDFDDKDVKALFTDEEWNELTKDRIGVPSFPRDIAEELAKYGSKTLKELRTKVMKSYLKEEEEYDVHKHYNQEWIQMTMRTLCNLFENIDTPLVKTQYEDWFTVALFGTCIDFCIRDAQLGTDVKRLLELGAIEGARAFAGISDNKYLLESFKMPKTLRDMYSDLIKAVNYDDQKADKLQIMIKNNLQILNILNDDDDTESDDLLKKLLEDEQYSTPPPAPIKFFEHNF
ncbi:10162_t:CDS:2 [Diversispora eburnea]|uniref:10162_t:CDS:1 n=1 Tax=Diversispora eburnea TaxID=1213867 RepID=A0A9N9B1F6_9GLOM|nr:10162_t:CDS:2 [Diversispora eburnea]